MPNLARVANQDPNSPTHFVPMCADVVYVPKENRSRRDPFFAGR